VKVSSDLTGAFSIALRYLSPFAIYDSYVLVEPPHMKPGNMMPALCDVNLLGRDLNAQSLVRINSEDKRSFDGRCSDLDGKG
jgi:hypothetical protein